MPNSAQLFGRYGESPYSTSGELGVDTSGDDDVESSSSSSDDRHHSSVDQGKTKEKTKARFKRRKG